MFCWWWPLLFCTNLLLCLKTITLDETLDVKTGGSELDWGVGFGGHYKTFFFFYLHVKRESCHHRKRRGRRCLILECVLADSGTLYGPKKKKRKQCIEHIL